MGRTKTLVRKVCRKTELCKNFQAGRCNSSADKCRFAHSDLELRSKADLSCTQMCHAVQRGLECTKVGCKFAHSEDELVSVVPSRSPFSPNPTCPETAPKTTGKVASGREDRAPPATTSLKPTQAMAERKATKIEVPESVQVSLEQDVGLEPRKVLRLSEELAVSEMQTQSVSSQVACPQSASLFARPLMPGQGFFSPAMDMFAPQSPMQYKEQGLGLDECDADLLPGLLIGLRGQVTKTEVPLAALALGCSKEEWEAATSCQRAYLD